MVVVGRGYGAGYWSPATATIDWCERNYEVTNYTFFFGGKTAWEMQLCGNVRFTPTFFSR